MCFLHLKVLFISRYRLVTGNPLVFNFFAAFLRKKCLLDSLDEKIMFVAELFCQRPNSLVDLDEMIC
jgi:hypothetical protein